MPSRSRPYRPGRSGPGRRPRRVLPASPSLPGRRGAGIACVRSYSRLRPAPAVAPARLILSQAEYGTLGLQRGGRRESRLPFQKCAVRVSMLIFSDVSVESLFRNPFTAPGSRQPLPPGRHSACLRPAAGRSLPPGQDGGRLGPREEICNHGRPLGCAGRRGGKGRGRRAGWALNHTRP